MEKQSAVTYTIDQENELSEMFLINYYYLLENELSWKAHQKKIQWSVSNKEYEYRLLNQPITEKFTHFFTWVGGFNDSSLSNYH